MSGTSVLEQFLCVDSENDVIKIWGLKSASGKTEHLTCEIVHFDGYDTQTYTFGYGYYEEEDNIEVVKEEPKYFKTHINKLKGALKHGLSVKNSSIFTPDNLFHTKLYRQWTENYKSRNNSKKTNKLNKYVELLATKRLTLNDVSNLKNVLDKIKLQDYLTTSFYKTLIPIDFKWPNNPNENFFLNSYCQ